jgi:hypothetical protein
MNIFGYKWQGQFNHLLLELSWFLTVEGLNYVHINRIFFSRH